jgi:fucose permease
MFTEIWKKRHYLLVYYFLHLVLLCLFLQPQWSFPFFLTALFTVGLFSIQQIVANPLAIKMGSPDTGAHRLTLAEESTFGTTMLFY